MSEIDPRALRTFVERLERLTEEAKLLASDIDDVYAEAVGAGFNREALRRLVAFRGEQDSSADERRLFLEYAEGLERE